MDGIYFRAAGRELCEALPPDEKDRRSAAAAVLLR